MLKKLFILLLSCFTILLYSQEPKTIVIGLIDTDPSSVISKNSIIADYLATKLSKYGISKGKIQVASSIDGMVNLINSNKVDIYIDTVFSTLQIKKKSEIEIVFRRWKKGIGEYKSILFAKKNSSINDLSNLNGKKVGFEDPGSTSGRWLPQGLLLNKKYQMIEIKNLDEIVPKDKLAFIYTGSVENSSVWVLQNKIDIGCLSTTDFNDLAQQIKDNIKIIGETINVPRQLVSFRKNLDKKLASELKNIFINLDKNSEGIEILKKWEKTAKIDTFDMNLIKDSEKIMSVVEGNSK